MIIIFNFVLKLHQQSWTLRTISQWLKFCLLSVASRLYKDVIDELEQVKEESEAGMFIFM